MVTTIQIEKTTVEQLKHLKEKMRARSYDAVVQQLIAKNGPKSMAGALGKKNMQWVLKDLRDKHDRF